MPNAEFAALQSKLRAFWPQVTLRTIGDIERTVVVVHSVPAGLPDHLVPVFPAYEERLCLVLSLLRAPRSRGRLRHRSRSTPASSTTTSVSCRSSTLRTPARASSRSRSSSGRNEPLASKPKRPGSDRADPEPDRKPGARADDALRDVGGRGRARAVRLGLPAYGSDPGLGALGTKAAAARCLRTRASTIRSGSRWTGGRPAAAREHSGVAAPARSARPQLDRGISGLREHADRSRLGGRRRPPLLVALEDTETDLKLYFASLEAEGGIVEERIERPCEAPASSSEPSPSGQVDIMSTHDRVLGGPHAQTYFGCHFPADQKYAEEIARAALRSGAARARRRPRTSRGRLRCGEGRRPLAVVRARDQPPLRRDAHPLFALTSLTDGVYDPLAAEWRTRLGDLKYYAATDHLDNPAYTSLTPDDLLDIVEDRELGWDERETGVVLHMVSALAVGGRIGLTAIGDTLEEARTSYYHVKAAVDEAAGVAST